MPVVQEITPEPEPQPVFEAAPEPPKHDPFANRFTKCQAVLDMENFYNKKISTENGGSITLPRDSTTFV